MRTRAKDSASTRAVAGVPGNSQRSIGERLVERLTLPESLAKQNGSVLDGTGLAEATGRKGVSRLTSDRHRPVRIDPHPCGVCQQARQFIAIESLGTGIRLISGPARHRIS